MSKCEFGVQVLTTGHWPTYRSLSADAVMPDVMGKMCDVSSSRCSSSRYTGLDWTVLYYTMRCIVLLLV
jgi:hypothetical protein